MEKPNDDLVGAAATSAHDSDQLESLKLLVSKAKSGNREAVEQIVKMFEPQIRMEARTRLGHGRLCPLLDSMDIAQSVFRLFFAQETIADKAVQDPRYLAELFAMMTRHRIIDHWRRQTADKRDVRKTRNLDDVLAELTTGQLDPAELAAFHELKARVLNRLTPDERDLARQRFAGETWQAIVDKQAEAGAAESSDAMRMRLSRAVQRACHEAGIEWPAG